MSVQAPMDEIQTWWEIPSIVQFCEVFSPFLKDLCRIHIDEFERAINENSYLLTNMAIRFIKICGWYNPNTNQWWNIMKKLLKKNKCKMKNELNDLKFELKILDSVKYFDELTCKQKVKALYILCHIILDYEHVQNEINKKPELWNLLNIQPIGYDLNKSVYWYFGNTRLYKEEFENASDLFFISPSALHENQNFKQVNNSDSSNFDFPKSLLIEPRQMENLGSRKWNLICNDDKSWHSFADSIKDNESIHVKSLHESVCRIIEKLPRLKREKTCYIFIKSFVSKSHLNNINTRTLRSGKTAKTFTGGSRKEGVKRIKLFTGSNVSMPEECLQNVNADLGGNDSLISQQDRTDSIENICDKNQEVATDEYENNNEHNKKSPSCNFSSSKNNEVTEKQLKSNSLRSCSIA